MIVAAPSRSSSASACALAGLLILAMALGGCAGTGGSRSDSLRETARVYTELGAGYIRKGRDQVAREKLERAIEADDDYAPAHATYALALARLGENDAAGRHFRRALKLTPEDPDIRNNYGAFLCARGQGEAAVEQFTRAAEVPGYVGRATALANAGLCMRDVEPAQAEDYLRKALELNPEDPGLLLQLAWVRHRQGADMSARGFLSRYMRVAQPPAAEALWLGAQIEAALGDNEAATEYRQRLAAQYPDFDEPDAGARDAPLDQFSP